ncbi:MAG TPA: hypothetical protein PLQ76_00055, partial [bacterium]|nr:hypothetical protein [bacterium]
FTRDDPRATALLYLFAPLCFLAHKTAVVLIGMPAALLFILNLKQINFKKISHLAGIAALVLAFNSFWLVPFLHLAKYKVTLAEAPHGLSYDPLRIFKDYFTLSKIMGHKVLVADKNTFVMVFLNTILRDLLLVCGALGIVDWLRSGKKRPAAFFAGIVLFFLALIYFGSFWGLSAQLNPTRYIGYLDFFLAVPASAGVAAVWRLLTRTSERRAKNISKFAAVCLLVFLIPAVAPYAFFFRQLNKRLDPDTHGLTEFLKTNSPAGERIMLEDSGWNDSDGAPPKYGESHFPALLSDITGREFIGGPYPYVFLRHHYADFHDGKFLQKKLSEYTDAEMRAALDSYNVGNIVCWSDECKNYFGRRESDFSKTGSFGKFLVYRRNSFTPSPFLVGSGYVFADHRGIRCYGLEPVNGKIVLKYHFYEGLVSDGGRISRTAVGHDPIGFIRVDNPAENLTIFNSYKW